MASNDISLIGKIVLYNDHKAFGSLIDKYQSEVRGIVFKMTNGDKALADDLSQEVFIRVYKHLKSFKATAKFSTWLYRITINVLYDYQKSKKYKNLPAIEKILNETESIENRIDINNALKILSDHEKIAIILYYEKGFSHREIKKIMNLPIGTVKTNILRGKVKLKKYFCNEK
jgi:RNA polymerase sigma-70 factor, ECF subfamily